MKSSPASSNASVASRRVRFNPMAEAELQDAAAWYDERSPGLGLPLRQLAVGAEGHAIRATRSFPSCAAQRCRRAADAPRGRRSSRRRAFATAKRRAAVAGSSPSTAGDRAAIARDDDPLDGGAPLRRRWRPARPSERRAPAVVRCPARRVVVRHPRCRFGRDDTGLLVDPISAVSWRLRRTRSRSPSCSAVVPSPHPRTPSTTTICTHLPAAGQRPNLRSARRRATSIVCEDPAERLSSSARGRRARRSSSRAARPRLAQLPVATSLPCIGEQF